MADALTTRQLVHDQLSEIAGAFAIRVGGVLDPAFNATVKPEGWQARAMNAVETVRRAYEKHGPMNAAVLNALKAAYAKVGFIAVLVREPEGPIYTPEAERAFVKAVELLTPPPLPEKIDPMQTPEKLAVAEAEAAAITKRKAKKTEPEA